MYRKFCLLISQVKVAITLGEVGKSITCWCQFFLDSTYQKGGHFSSEGGSNHSTLWCAPISRAEWQCVVNYRRRR